MFLDINNFVPAETVQELVTKLKKADEVMQQTDYSITAVMSATELFLRFITLATLDYPVSWKNCKEFNHL